MRGWTRAREAARESVDAARCRPAAECGSVIAEVIVCCASRPCTLRRRVRSISTCRLLIVLAACTLGGCIGGSGGAGEGGSGGLALRVRWEIDPAAQSQNADACSGFTPKTPVPSGGGLFRRRRLRCRL